MGTAVVHCDGANTAGECVSEGGGGRRVGGGGGGGGEEGEKRIG